jgi:S1-C subfamily serine protease
VPLKVLRDGKAQSLSVTVEELDLENEGQAETSDEGDAASGFGMTLQDLTPDIARQLRVPAGTSGAVVVDMEPRGAAARGGLQPRDVIVQVNRQAVEGVADATRELQRVGSGQVATVLVVRGGQELFLTLRKD